MHWLREQIRNAPQPDTIVHLGAGLCRELDVWRESGAQRIVLVEPNPELLPELRRSVRGAEPVEIVPAAIAAQSGRESFRLFNFPMLSSLREPTGLYQILPGLTQIGRAMVETRTMGQLLDDLDLHAEGEHWLVIDTPGEETTVVDQLCQNVDLQKFSRTFLSAGIEPMYQGAKTAQELLRLLQPLGIESVGAPDTTDADWPRYHLRLDRMALECQRLKAELAEQRQWEHALKADLEAVHNSLRTVEKVLAESERQHQTELEVAKVASQKELAALQETSAEKIRELEVLLSEEKTASEQLRKELHDSQKEFVTLRESKAELVKKLGKYTKREENLKAQQAEIVGLKEQREELVKQVESLKPLEAQKKQALAQLEQVAKSRDTIHEQLQKHTEEAHKLNVRISQLEEENLDYKERHELLEEELIKAEAQIELIKQLFLSGDDALNWDDETGTA